jgi:hypothetical protein
MSADSDVTAIGYARREGTNERVGVVAGVAFGHARLALVLGGDLWRTDGKALLRNSYSHRQSW